MQTRDEQTLETKARSFRDELEEEFEAVRAAKETLALEERAQIGRMVEIEEMKKQIMRKLANLRSMENDMLSVKRKGLIDRDKMYDERLRKHEDEEMATRKQAKRDECHVAPYHLKLIKVGQG